MNPFYSIVVERAGHICEYCHAPDSVFNFSFEVDHFVPLKQGGTKDLENLVLACRACNAYKAFHQIGLGEKEETERLFNPRQDVWEKHFQVNVETLAIEGRTKIGQGTINRLQMNNFEQIKARQLWNQFGVFP